MCEWGMLVCVCVCVEGGRRRGVLVCVSGGGWKELFIGSLKKLLFDNSL